MFDYTSSELELWLEHLGQVEPEHQDTVIHFLERVRPCDLLSSTEAL